MAEELELGEALEGIKLGLGAMSEVLNKQNDVLTKMIKKQEEEDEEEKEKEAKLSKEQETAALVKAVEDALEKSGKFVLKQDSKETARAITSKPDEQQKVIQAATPGDEDEKEKEEVVKQAPEEDENKEKEDEKEKEYPEMEKLQKELDDLKKGFDSRVTEAVQTKLQKMGWREEKGLVGPKRVELGTDGVPMLKKGMDQEDRVAELAKLDYATLKKMEIEAESGDLPPEIKQLLQ